MQLTPDTQLGDVMSTELVAVLIDDWPEWNPPFSEDWKAFHIDDSKEFAALIWFEGLALDAEGLMYWNDDRLDDGASVPKDVMDRFSDVINIAVYEHIVYDYDCDYE